MFEGEGVTTVVSVGAASAGGGVMTVVSLSKTAGVLPAGGWLRCSQATHIIAAVSVSRWFFMGE